MDGGCDCVGAFQIGPLSSFGSSIEDLFCHSWSSGSSAWLWFSKWVAISSASLGLGFQAHADEVRRFGASAPRFNRSIPRFVDSRSFAEVVAGSPMEHGWKDERSGGKRRMFDRGEQWGAVSSLEISEPGTEEIGKGEGARCSGAMGVLRIFAGVMVLSRLICVIRKGVLRRGADHVVKHAEHGLSEEDVKGVDGDMGFHEAVNDLSDVGLVYFSLENEANKRMLMLEGEG
ncbi:hypothetical protein ABZP36_003353 [Zizania latifolia]